MIEGSKDKGVPIDASFTKIEKEVVDGVLKSIAKNPDKAIFETGRILRNTTRELEDFTYARAMAFGNEAKAREYIEGSIWAYKLFIAQAEKRNKTLPILTRNVTSAFFQDIIDNIGEHESINSVFITTFSKLKDAEPEIKTFADEICKYRPDSSCIRGAMGETYFLLLKAAKTNTLNNLFVEE